jgi:hypothetical protein
MSDAAIFVLVFGGLLVLRIVAATVVFVLILPRGDRCPLCDAVTVRVHSPALGRIRLAKRWCLACGWDGVMRTGPTDAPALTKAEDATAHPHPPVGQPSRKL